MQVWVCVSVVVLSVFECDRSLARFDFPTPLQPLFLADAVCVRFFDRMAGLGIGRCECLTGCTQFVL